MVLVTTLLGFVVVCVELDEGYLRSHRWARVFVGVGKPFVRVLRWCSTSSARIAALRPGGKINDDRVAAALSLSRFAPRLAESVVSRADIPALAHIPVPEHPVHRRTARALVRRASMLASAQAHEGHTLLEFPTRVFANVAANTHDPDALRELFTAPQFRENIVSLVNRNRYQFGDIERAIGSNPNLTAAILASSMITAPAALSILRAVAENGRDLLAEHLGVPFSITDAGMLLAAARGQHFSDVVAALEEAKAASPAASSSAEWATALACIAGRGGDRSIAEAAELLERLAAGAPGAVALFVRLLRAGATASFEDLADAVPALIGAVGAHA